MSTAIFAAAIANKNAADIAVAITPPIPFQAVKCCCAKALIGAMMRTSATTMVAWPSEKKKPTASGRRPSCISLRVMLSIAAI